MENLPSHTAVSAPPRRWPLFLLGFLLFLLGPAINIVQVILGHLVTPWYVMPVLAAFGVLLMAGSVLQRPGVWRSVALVVFALLCGLEWYFVLVVAKTPPYEGPQVSDKVPQFAATYADGRAFANKELEDGKSTVLLFYRGHW